MDEEKNIPSMATVTDLIKVKTIKAKFILQILPIEPESLEHYRRVDIVGRAGDWIVLLANNNLRKMTSADFIGYLIGKAEINFPEASRVQAAKAANIYISEFIPQLFEE